MGRAKREKALERKRVNRDRELEILESSLTSIANGDDVAPRSASTGGSTKKRFRRVKKKDLEKKIERAINNKSILEKKVDESSTRNKRRKALRRPEEE